MYISRFYNQINFFIILINGGDFDKCGGNIDGDDFAVGRFDLHSCVILLKTGDTRIFFIRCPYGPWPLFWHLRTISENCPRIIRATVPQLIFHEQWQALPIIPSFWGRFSQMIFFLKWVRFGKKPEAPRSL